MVAGGRRVSGVDDPVALRPERPLDHESETRVRASPCSSTTASSAPSGAGGPEGPRTRRPALRIMAPIRVASAPPSRHESPTCQRRAAARSAAMRSPRLAVRAVILREGRLLLVNAWKGRTHLWTCPGGGVEVHQSLPEALVREVHEETGLTVAVGAPCLINEFHDPRDLPPGGPLLPRTVTAGDPDGAWTDPEGIVSHRIWVTRAEMGARASSPTASRRSPGTIPARWSRPAGAHRPVRLRRLDPVADRAASKGCSPAPPTTWTWSVARPRRSWPRLLRGRPAGGRGCRPIAASSGSRGRTGSTGSWRSRSAFPSRATRISASCFSRPTRGAAAPGGGAAAGSRRWPRERGVTRLLARGARRQPEGPRLLAPRGLRRGRPLRGPGPRHPDPRRRPTIGRRKAL